MGTAPGKLVAATFALSAFSVAIIAGLAAGNAPTRVLTTALVSMVACHVLGLCLGAVGERVMNEHLANYKAGAPKEGAARAAPAAAGAKTA